jgi:hypothetical protein
MMLNKFSSNNYQLVELVIPAGTNSSRFYFADQPRLRGKKIELIEWYDPSLVGPSPGGFVTTLATNNVFLTLCDQSGFEFVSDMPIYEINGLKRIAAGPTTLNGNFALEPKIINFTKSYVSFSSSAPAGQARSIVFGFYFL